MTTDLTEPANQREFLEATWSQLAALAWQGYKENGRGAVVVIQDKITVNPVARDNAGFSLNLIRGDVWYITEATAPDNELPPASVDVIKGYDPHNSIVVLFVTKNLDFDIHYIEQPKGEPAPPQAYAAHRGNWLMN